jgi:hypothetical protein
MSLTSHDLAILALLVTSMIVRVLPVFIRLPLNDTTRGLLERELPMAVFLNFAVYIIWTEIHTSPLEATLALGVVAIISFATRIGLVGITCAATFVYILTLFFV